MDFLQQIKAIAKQKKVKIVLPETNDPRTIKAAKIILQEKICDLVLIGNKDVILREGQELSAATFIDPETDDLTALAEELYQLRKEKGMTQEQALDILKTQPLYLGVMLVQSGQAQGMVAGAVNSTGDVLRPSLQIIKTAPGTQVVSSCFVMIVPNFDKPFLFSDSALVQEPTSAELAAIAKSTAESYRTFFNEEPIVAMLSHSTMGSAKHAMIDKVVEATRLAKEQNPDLQIDGELQLDAAIVPSVASLKAGESDVAGRANVLIFPNIDAGNIGYKLVQRFAKAEAFGPVTQGLRKPVNDLSRGCSFEDIIGVVAITAVQGQAHL